MKCAVDGCLSVALFAFLREGRMAPCCLKHFQHQLDAILEEHAKLVDIPTPHLGYSPMLKDLQAQLDALAADEAGREN